MNDGHPLDNPGWGALSGPLAAFAVRTGAVVRCIPEIGPFTAMERYTPAGFADLAAILVAGGEAGLVTAEAPQIPADIEIVVAAELLQMVADPLLPASPAEGMRELTAADVPAMLALVELTRPGPFLPRTIELGRYLGAFVDAQLVAMAGERMRLEGFTEVSAVCTHPDFRGRGYGRALVSAVAQGIVDRGETPFLHVIPDNRAAIAVYEGLGFRARRIMQLRILASRSGGPSPAHP